jgi:predicted AAA+ superfamily ATPase
MDPNLLLEVAADWSHWAKAPPTTVARTVDLPRELRPDLALAIQGVRRCGKSTLLSQLMQRYKLDRRRCMFVNFEDPRLLERLDHKTLQALVDVFEKERGPGCTWFFDEIQCVDGWQRWLRTQLDRPRDRRFVITGSNSALLSGELGSSLTGRHHLVELFPFDFDEFRKARPGGSLNDYLHSGGFPAAVASPDGDRLLMGYFNDIVERDMRERVGARSTMPLRQLVQMLYESAGSELSARRVATAIGVTDDTTALYLEAAEAAYLAFASPYFAWSARQRSTRNRKWYPIDPGLRRSAVTRTGGDRGKQLECAVFLALRRRYREVFHWRNGGEVDFVVLHDNKPLPIQVTWDKPLERHGKAIDAFHKAHRDAHEAVFVTAASFAAGMPELPDVRG